PLYSISYQNGNKKAYMDMTQKGGHPLTLLVDRPIGEKKLSLNEGQKKSEQYLRDHNFEQMTLSESREYDHVGVYSFVYEEDDIRIYPDSIEIKVALDQGDILGVSAKNYFMHHHDRDIPEPNITKEEDDIRIYPDSIEIKVALDQGDILGVSAKNYFMHHHDRDIPEPNITKEEAKKNVNPNVDIQEENVAIIENDLGEEVLTYEFIGVLDQDTYRIFINADHGQEEQVEKLGGTETNYAGS